MSGLKPGPISEARAEAEQEWGKDKEIRAKARTRVVEENNPTIASPFDYAQGAAIMGHPYSPDWG
jgi:hypothetical protein